MGNSPEEICWQPKSDSTLETGYTDREARARVCLPQYFLEIRRRLTCSQIAICLALDLLRNLVRIHCRNGGFSYPRGLVLEAFNVR